MDGGETFRQLNGTGKYLNLRLMEERIVDVAEVYATWNVPHFVPIEVFAYFTLYH